MRLSVLISFLIFTGVVGAWANSTPPETTVSLTPDVPDGEDGWYKTPVGVTLTASDLESGVESINWRLNGGGWQGETFSQSMNLAPNPSFEEGTGETITSWVFSGTVGASGSQDSSASKFDTHSARISANQNGWSGFNNQTDYIVATPWESMVASVWVKTEAVFGVGAFFKVFALSPSGAAEITSSPTPLTGTNDWTQISKEFIVTVSDAYGVYVDLGLEGVGSVWFDGVEVYRSAGEVSTSFTVSQNGEHLLEYYSIDRVGNEELPHRSVSFKIDTQAPRNWRGFSATRQPGYNDHTFDVAVTVSDWASGMDIGTGFYKYSYNGGESWSGWLPVDLYNPGSDGANDVTLTALAVDFHDSYWEVTKMIRFKVSDLAGLWGESPNFSLNGAWVKTTLGDIYGGGGISMASATGPNADGVVISTSAIDGFSSTNDWLVKDYTAVERWGFGEWLRRFPTTTPLPRGRLPKIGGLFYHSGDLTIDSRTIPQGFDSASFAAVVFVDGDLIINYDFSLHPNAVLVFIVDEDILVDKRVGEFAGFFIADDNFNSAYNGGSPHELLTIKGGVVADKIALPRSLSGNKNTTTPAEVIDYEPKYLLLVRELLGGEGAITWREATP